jgi:hypothetical protein
MDMVLPLKKSLLAVSAGLVLGLTLNQIGPEEYPFSNAFPSVREFAERESNILILPEAVARQTIDRISCDEFYSYDESRHVFESLPIETSSRTRMDTFRWDGKRIGAPFVYAGNTYTILPFGVERKHGAVTDTIPIPPLPYSDFLALTDSATYYEDESPLPVALSSYISTACIRQNKLWVGFAGGYPEGTGDPGGFAMLDLRRGRWEVVWKPELIELDITGIVPFADTLIWMSTWSHGEFFTMPGGTWEYNTNSGALTKLPTGGMDHEYVIERKSVVISYGPFGVSVFDRATREWQNLHWILDLNADGSRVVSHLVPDSTYLKFKTEFPNRNTALYYAHYYQAHSLRELLTVAQKTLQTDFGDWISWELSSVVPVEFYPFIPVDSLLRMRDLPNRWYRNSLLDLVKRAHPDLLPTLKALSDSAETSVVIPALTYGDTVKIHLKQIVTQSRDAKVLCDAAIALYGMDDKSGLNEILRRLTINPKITLGDGELLTNALVTMNDPAAVPVLANSLAINDDWYGVQFAALALAQIQSDESVEALGKPLLKPGARSHVLAYLNSRGASPQFDDIFVPNLIRVMRTKGQTDVDLAFEILKQIGESRIVSVLIDRLQKTYTLELQELTDELGLLVQLKGDDLDYWEAKDPSKVGDIASRCAEWWSKEKDSFRMLSPKAGLEAFNTWKQWVEKNKPWAIVMKTDQIVQHFKQVAWMCQQYRLRPKSERGGAGSYLGFSAVEYPTLGVAIVAVTSDEVYLEKLHVRGVVKADGQVTLLPRQDEASR